MIPRVRQLQTVWAALVLGVLAYGGVAYGLLATRLLNVEGLEPDVLRIVAAVVLGYMAVGLVLRQRLVAGAMRLADAADRLQRYQVATLVPLAIIESGGLVIVTLGLLSGAGTWILAGCAASVLMMWVARPRPGERGFLDG